MFLVNIAIIALYLLRNIRNLLLCAHGIFDLLEMCNFSRRYGLLLPYKNCIMNTFTNLFEFNY